MNERVRDVPVAIIVMSQQSHAASAVDDTDTPSTAEIDDEGSSENDEYEVETVWSARTFAGCSSALS